MGLSQTGYLGGKIAPPKTGISAIMPARTVAQAVAANNAPVPITITGTNFGDVHPQGSTIALSKDLHTLYQ
jgi:hypothetical protein